MCSMANAGRITWHEAYQKAHQFILDRGSITRSGDNADAAFDVNNADTTRQNVYIFNRKDERGFVIVAGDDRLPGVIGYSERGHLDRATAPCGLQWLLDSYDELISKMGPDYKPAARKAIPIHPSIEPFVDTDWGQFNPYNDYCPELNGRPCAAGCVAVALAMAVNYTKWPEDSTTVIPGYTTATHKFELDTLPKKKFRWDNMNRSETAWLMLYCGMAIKTDYMNGASTAYNSQMPLALKKYFGYSKNTKIIHRSNFPDSVEWDSLMYDELANGRCVIYNAFTENTQGHNFVLNGYWNGYYYINWGWTGQCNGYYDLNDLQAGGYNFNFGQCAIVNIRKPLPDDTAIEHRTTDSSTFDIYTLTGMKVRSHATTLDGLPKGIYLVNGRKVLVK